MKNFEVGDKVVRFTHRKSAGWYWYEKEVTVKFIHLRGHYYWLEFNEVPGIHPSAFFEYLK